jgi:hypothetical protein
MALNSIIRHAFIASKPALKPDFLKFGIFFVFFSKKSCFFNNYAIQYILEIIKKTSALVGGYYIGSLVKRDPSGSYDLTGLHCRRGLPYAK